MKLLRLLSYAALPMAALLLVVGYVRARETSAGMQVTPVDYPGSDMAQLLDAHFWRFNVTHVPQSAPGEEVNSTVIVREANKPSRLIGGIGIVSAAHSPLHDGPLIVAIAPADGNDLQHARKIRCLVRCGSGSSSTIAANPFLGTNSFSAGSRAEREADGSYLLASAGRTRQATSPRLDNDATLSLSDVTLSLTVQARHLTLPPRSRRTTP